MERDEIVHVREEGGQKIYGYDRIMIKCSGSTLLQYGGVAPVDDIASPERTMLQSPVQFFVVVFITGNG